MGSCGAGGGSEREVLGPLQWFVATVDLMERHLASLLIEMSASGLVCELECLSIGASAENRLGHPRTSIEDRVRVARSLAKRPQAQRAYVTGATGLETALLAVQILGPGYVDASSENEWAVHLKESTVKRLRDEKRAVVRDERRRTSRHARADARWSVARVAALRPRRRRGGRATRR